MAKTHNSPNFDTILRHLMMGLLTDTRGSGCYRGMPKKPDPTIEPVEMAMDSFVFQIREGSSIRVWSHFSEITTHAPSFKLISQKQTYRKCSSIEIFKIKNQYEHPSLPMRVDSGPRSISLCCMFSLFWIFDQFVLHRK